MFVSISLRDGRLGSPRPAATWTLQFSARASHPSAARSAALLCEHSLALHCPASATHFTYREGRTAIHRWRGSWRGSRGARTSSGARPSSWHRSHRSIIPKKGSPNTLAQTL